MSDARTFEAVGANTFVLGGESAEFDASSKESNRGAVPAIGGGTKRAVDLCISGVLVFLLIPLLIGLAIAVRMTSPGPALFWSERIGRNGRIFHMPKFRTMQVGAPLRPREEFVNGDSYLTPIGAFLRQSSLDELPQLLSVLLGDMSIVGPRPVILTDPTVKARAPLAALGAARPGVTGLAQIRGRNKLRPRYKARYDAFYARNWTKGLDFWILAVTLVKVLARKDVL